MKMEKVKKFWEEHKTVIAFFAGAGAVCIGACIGAAVDKSNRSKFYKENGPSVLSVLDDYLSKPRGDSKVFSGAHTDGFKPAELGELGSKILELGCSENQTFTHFIAIGESIE